ncbi:hypothetical protein ANCDUO_24162 [Ancylostoma duodenale]|uniref:Uncharacterized protein n=1 Tax=Ancylostoma duodenale TaxID=51022 RepID=A0A0C2C804_9BILA|nr:hypothetical protein ANCDUO_24162 [Ancylostoma duodenale]
MNMQCFVAFCIACFVLVAGFDERAFQNDAYEPEPAVADSAFFRNFRSSSNGKPTFIRFGKRAQPSFIRFGRAQPSFIRFGRQATA